jgi:hypothetical protein
MRKIIILSLGFFSSLCSYCQWTTNATHIYNSNSGNVGIGTTSPGYKFEVNGSSYFSGLTTYSVSTAYVQKWNAVTGNAFVALQINGTDQGYIEWGTNATRNGSGTEMLITNRQGKLSLSDNTNNGITLSGGNIGVGTTSPAYKLDVSGTSYFSGLMTNTVSLGNIQNWNAVSGNAYIGLQKNGIDQGYIEWGANAARNDSGTEMFINNKQGKLNLFDGSNDGITINEGDVGIGTTSPSEKLSVNGNVYASGNISAYGFIKTKKIVVTQTAWPDYVFAKKYRLRSLASLESFIKQNKHLPEVPSAREVEEKGISVGDNQALLLKKIEELTLYVIALKKEVDLLKKSNNR